MNTKGKAKETEKKQNKSDIYSGVGLGYTTDKNSILYKLYQMIIERQK